MKNINPNPFTTRPEIEGTFGVVTSTHWIATAVGMAMLEKGGNAFDAAVATAFTLQVVEPHLNGPGGDVPVIINDVRTGKTEVICGQGPAPAKATIAHYRSLGLDMVPGTGLLAACVPGMFDTWMLLLRDYGTMRLADVLAPAIYYAGQGHPLVERAHATIATVEELFRKYWPTSAAVYLPGGAVPETGTLFTNTTLAETYTRVLREAKSVGGDRVREIEAARKVWSQGFVAEAIDRFCRTQAVMDTSGTAHHGVLTGDDMARWHAHIEAPLTYDYGRYTVCKPGPWAQGPVMLQQLALLKGFDLDSLDPASADFVHILVECSKLAYADREKFYGDPDFVQVPMATLLSDAYNDERRKLVGDKASLELCPGSVEGFGAVVKLRREEGQRRAVGGMGAGEPTVGRIGEVRGDTVHFDIVDQAGNMVSATPSGGWLQSSPVIPELGFCLGTRAQMFWLEEGHPAALAPGKRPRTTLSPTLALARRRILPRLGLARRRPAGSMDHPAVHAPRPRRDEPAGGDRRAGLALRAFPDLVLAAHGAAGRARGRASPAGEHGDGARPPRSHRRGRRRLVRGTAHRRFARRPPPPRRRQSARHAGLRGGPIGPDRPRPDLASRSGDPCCLEHESDPLLDRAARKLDQLVAVSAVDIDHRFVGPHRLLEALFAFAVLPEDVGPWRRDEDPAVIAERGGGLFHVVRHRQSQHPQITDHVRHPAVEEDRPRLLLRQMVGAHLPAQHQFGERLRVAPGQRRPADRHLVLNDAAPGLDRSRAAGLRQGVDQRGLSRPGAAGHDEQPLRIAGHGDCLLGHCVCGRL